MNKNKIIDGIMFLILAACVVVGYTISHEIGHKQIMEYFTCEEAKISIGALSGETVCEEDKTFGKFDPSIRDKVIFQVYLEELKAQSMHETIGYHMQMLVFTLLLMIGVMMGNKK